MNLFGYFDLGRRAIAAFNLGAQIAGDNIANAATPGYARRRAELVPGRLVPVPGGWLDQGVDVARIVRMEDRFLQSALERETGGLGFAEERLRGLRLVESVFGEIEGAGIASALSGFAAAFETLAAEPESLASRRGAVSAAGELARALRETSGRLEAERRLLDQQVSETVERVNGLARELASLNRQIFEAEADGSVAAPLRDRRGRLLEELASLTGGWTVAAPGGRVSFELPSGVTLVSGDHALPLGTARGADGAILVLSGADGSDVTARLRGGKLGGLLDVRDGTIPRSLAELDALASDLIARANALTTSASDLSGSPGLPLFEPDPPPAVGAAAKISVRQAVAVDPALLAISGNGAPGDGSVALEIARLVDTASAALGGKSPQQFVADVLARIGNEVAQADVSSAVSGELVEGLLARRDAVSGVSLDEEALELVRNQRSLEAASKFLRVLDEMTQTVIGLLER